MVIDIMNGEYAKFREWTTELDDYGYRSIRQDAPDEIKAEAKKADEEHFKKTGRHMYHLDY